MIPSSEPDPGDADAGASGARIVPAARLERAALVELFNRSYVGYFAPVSLTEASLAAIVEAWDLDLEASRVALRGDSGLGFTFLAIRGRRGWIGGMGVPPGARGQGWGRATLVAALDEARARGLEFVDLEVLEPNLPAIRIYERCGFVDRRRLEVWARAPGPLPAAPEAAAGITVEAVPVERCLEQHARFHPEGVPWQRDLPVLERQCARLEARALVRDGRLLGWALALGDRDRVQVQDLVLHPDAAVAHAVALLRAVVIAHPDAALRLVNLPRGAREAAALEALGFGIEWVQREMRVALGAPPARRRSAARA